MDGKVDESLVKVGNKIPMQDSEGHRLTGVVKSLENDAVVMDFNHPLAGNSLFFKGEVTHIRQATEEEISHGHLHGSSDCGCCSGCGDDAQIGSGCCS
jgi:FKBP-type peptidyl-prolyl cis-trans isomerase SlyD